jgi:hypothetical protein
MLTKLLCTNADAIHICKLFSCLHLPSSTATRVVLIQQECTLWPGPHSTFSGTRTPKKMGHYYGWKIWWSESRKGNSKWFTANSNNQLLSVICSWTQLPCSTDDALEHSHSGLNNSNTGVPGSTPLAFAWMSARRWSIKFANAFNYLFMNMPAIPKCQNSDSRYSGTPLKVVCSDPVHFLAYLVK